MDRLRDKTAVITGAASGIGRATALLFAREGARVVCVDIDAARGQATARAVSDLGRDALFVQADVSISSEVQRLARTCQDSAGAVDILFSNAGQVIWQGFEATTEQTWSQMLGVNLTGAFLCAKYLLPLIKRAPAGCIINHASVDAILGRPDVAAYSAAKGGLIPLTHTMAGELGRYGIRVNCISSGGIATSLSVGASEEAWQQLLT